MNFIKILKDDLEKGYSKSDLEKLIGLPQNHLSGIIKGDKKLSRKSEIKIAQWEASEKPNPLSVFFVKKELLGKTIKPVTSLISKEPVTVIINAEDHFPFNKKDRELIEKYETELSGLGDSQFAKARKKWLINKIKELKK